MSQCFKPLGQAAAFLKYFVPVYPAVDQKRAPRLQIPSAQFDGETTLDNLQICLTQRTAEERPVNEEKRV